MYEKTIVTRKFAFKNIDSTKTQSVGLYFEQTERRLNAKILKRHVSLLFKCVVVTNNLPERDRETSQ